MFSTADFQLALRHLRKSPGYTATAVLTFALAIGANSAIFSAVSAILLRPLPVSAPESLAVVWQTDERGQAVIELTYRHLREWTTASNTFAGAAVMGSHNWSAVLQGRGEPSRIWFNGVSARFFDTLGVMPFLGRGLRPDDDIPNAPPVAVLNHGAWVRRFGADTSIIGSTMTLDSGPVQIVGVMPPGVDFPRAAEFWVPVVPLIASGTPPTTKNLDGLGVFYVVGRVRPGLGIDGVRSEIDAAEARLDRAEPGRLKWGSRTVATPFVDYVFGPVRPALRMLWAAGGVLLLIACANISGLMLTRVSQRRQEHGVRLALGASRASIGRLWVAEALVVAVAGGILGLAAAHWMARAIVTLAPDDLPRIGDVGIDARVALFTFAVVLTTAVVTGVMPLRHARADSLVSALDRERSTAGQSTMRARSALSVVQIGLAVVLLVAAGLVLRSFIALRQIDLGFTPERVLTLTVQPADNVTPANVWLHDFLRDVRGMPGVEAAGAVYLRPLMLGPIGQNVAVFLEGQPETRQTAESNPTLNHQIATPGYFEAMKIPLRAGRFFTDQDTVDAPRVVVVSDSTARRLWPGQTAVGKRLSMSGFTPGKPGRAWRTVVGVVSDVRYRALDEVQLDVYDPALQVGRAADNVVLRTSGNPLAIANAVRAAARSRHPSTVVDSITTMDAVVARAESPWRLTMWIFVLFALLAFGLAALGLFSLVALDVAHRGREFAIRFALGASRTGILRSVLRRAAWHVTIGLSTGLLASFVVGRAMRGLLFGIPPGDLATYAAVPVLVAVVVAIAAYVPARRAGRVDPQALLRQG
jgi:putative ABC transport system permease protein